MQENYDLLLERISSSSGIDKVELEKRVEARRAKLSGLISKEGAAQILAAELGVKFENVQLKLSELVAGMKKVNVVGKIINLFPAREFNKNGKSGKVLNFILADDTGNTRVVLWDMNHIMLIESGQIKQDDVVELRNVSVREGEIHLSGFSEMMKNGAVFNSVKTEKAFSEKQIDSIKEGNSVSLRGVVVQVFAPRFFFVCPQCGKKAIQSADSFSCVEHGNVVPKERALMNFVLDDGTETLRVVLFSDQLEKLFPIEKLKDNVSFLEIKNDFLGTELFISGIVKKNQLFNNLELTGQNVVRANPDEIVARLEK